MAGAILEATPSLVHFGSELKAIRRSQNLSQAQAGDAASLSRRSVIRWEAGVVRPHQYELKQLLSALKVAREDQIRLLGLLSEKPSQARLDPPACLACVRGRLGNSVEDLAAVAKLHPATVRRWESGSVKLSSRQLLDLSRALPLAEAERQAMKHALNPSAPVGASQPKWASFDFEAHAELLEAKSHLDWSSSITSAYAANLARAGRFREARTMAEKVTCLQDARSAIPKPILHQASCAAAQSYFRAGWRSAQRGLAILCQLQRVAAGRASVVEYQVAMSDCFRIHGKVTHALSWAGRAVETAQSLQHDSKERAQLCLVDGLLAAGLPDQASRHMVDLASQTPEGTVHRLKRMAAIKRALGQVDEAEHWSSTARQTIEDHDLHGLFRLWETPE